MLFVSPDAGGRIEIIDDYITGSPDLAVEVAGSTVRKDLGPKLAAYLRNDIREYIVWRVDDNVLDWFVLRDGQYVPLPVSADGLYRSANFPGLWLDISQLLAFDVTGLLATLARGAATPEHAAFAARLSAARCGE